MAVKRYNGSSWDTVAGLGAQGAAATSSSITTWVKTAAGGETSLTGSSDSSTTLAYTPGQEQFFINGVLQVRGSDYTATNGTSITGISALIAGDVATVTTVNAFSVAEAVPLSTVTANGDLIVGTSSGAVGRLGIGSTGNLLTVAGGVPTWAAPAAAPGANWTLVNAGGTSMSGAGTVTVSGLSSDKLFIRIVAGSLSGTQADISFRFNADSGSVYNAGGMLTNAAASYDAGNFSSSNTSAGNQVYFLKTSNQDVSTFNAVINVSACKSTTIRPFNGVGASTGGGGSAQQGQVFGGIYTGTSAITSFSIISAGTNFDAGTIFIYGAN